MSLEHWDDICFEGCVAVLGAHIGDCLKDFAHVHNRLEEFETELARLKSVKYTSLSGREKSQLYKTKLAIFNYRSAKHYLFGWALDFHCLCVGEVSPNFIREQAIKMANEICPPKEGEKDDTNSNGRDGETSNRQFVLSEKV